MAFDLEFMNEIISIEENKQLTNEERSILLLYAAFEDYRRKGGSYEELKQAFIKKANLS
jgi:hypothetical protein